MICAVLCVSLFASGCSRISENGKIPVPENSAGSLSANSGTDKNSYIYSSLSEKEKEYYDILRDAVYNYDDQAVFPEKISPDTLRKLFIAVYYNEEGLFWLTSMFYRPSSDSDTLKLTYRFDREESAKMQKEIDSTVKEIMEAADKCGSDYEKLKLFHDHIVLNCTFVMDSQYGNTIYGVLCDGYAQCEGYAFAFDYLCKQAEIPCFTVTGTNSEGAAHAWNIVELDGKWYHADCTWDDPILDPPDTEFIRHYYFLVSDSDISGVTHIPDNTYFTFPVCTATDNYYVREGLFASSAADGKEKLMDSAAAALAMGRKDAGVRFSSKKAYDDAVKSLFDRRGIKDVFAYVNKVSERKVLEGKYVRYCNDDELIIHISMIYE